MKEHREGVSGTEGFGEGQAGLYGGSLAFVGGGSQGPGLRNISEGNLLFFGRRDFNLLK